METENQIVVVNPDVMLGKSILKGTRITVELILKSLAAGETFANLLSAHPRLTEQGIYAALDFAAEALKGEKIYPIAS